MMQKNLVKSLTNITKLDYKNDFSVNFADTDNNTFSVFGGCKENNQSLRSDSVNFSGNLNLNLIDNVNLNILSGRVNVLRNIFSILKVLLVSVRYGWYLEYSIVGYNFSFILFF